MQLRMVSIPRAVSVLLGLFLFFLALLYVIGVFLSLMIMLSQLSFGAFSGSSGMLLVVLQLRLKVSVLLGIILGAGLPLAKFTAHRAGASRVNATSADGRYSFQLRVDVGPQPT